MVNKSTGFTSIELRRSAVALAVVQWNESPPTQIPGSPVRYEIDNAIKVLQPFSEEGGSNTLIAWLSHKCRHGSQLRSLHSSSIRCDGRRFGACKPIVARFVAGRPVDFNGRFGVIEMREVL